MALEQADSFKMVPSCVIFVSQDEDRGIQFTVMTDRAQGGASLNDGQLELMVTTTPTLIY